MYCTVLHCTALYCTVLYRGVGALRLVRGSLRLEAIELTAAVPGVGALVPGQQDTLTYSLITTDNR